MAGQNSHENVEDAMEGVDIESGEWRSIRSSVDPLMINFGPDLTGQFSNSSLGH